MTVVAPTAPATAPATAPTRTLPAARGIAVRGLRYIRRLPSAFVPALLMPIAQTIAFSGTFFAITTLPGFPTDRSVNWFLPLAVTMGSSFAGLSIGFTTIRDIESGYYDRLRMSPAPRAALLLGPLLTAWIRVILVVTVAFGVGVAFGARLTGGPLGLVLLYLVGIGVSTIGAGWGLGLAYRFRDMRAAALMQLTLFLSLFLTPAQAPMTVIVGWLHAVARVNPFTNVLRLARAGFVGDIAWSDVWGGLVALTVLGGLAMWFARRGLDRLDR